MGAKHDFSKKPTATTPNRSSNRSERVGRQSEGGPKLQMGDTQLRGVTLSRVEADYLRLLTRRLRRYVAAGRRDDAIQVIKEFEALAAVNQAHARVFEVICQEQEDQLRRVFGGTWPLSPDRRSKSGVLLNDESPSHTDDLVCTDINFRELGKDCVEQYAPNRRNVARHEAGHALVAWLTNYLPIRRIDVFRQYNRWHGNVSFETTELDFDSADCDFFKKLIMVAMSGELAIHPTIAPQRLVEAMQVSDWHPLVCGMSKVATANTGNAIFKEARDKTATLLAKHRCGLDILAHQIWKHKTVSGDQVDELLRLTCGGQRR